MKQRTHRPPVARTLVMAGTMLAAVACGSAGVTNNSTSSSAASSSITGGPGVDVANKTITIGVIDALSGPAAALGAPALSGAQAFWDDVNANGGIDGWKVTLGPAKDDNYPSTQQHVQAFNQIKDSIAILESLRQPDDPLDPEGRRRPEAGDGTPLLGSLSGARTSTWPRWALPMHSMSPTPSTM